MPIELIETESLITSVNPIKKGKKDDSPLYIVIGLELNLKAHEILPQFHPNLRHFLYAEDGLRFEPGFSKLAWKEKHLNMELEILNLSLQVEKLHKYNIYPYVTHKDISMFFSDQEMLDDRDMLWLTMEAIIPLLAGQTAPLSLLSEMINTTLNISVRPSQLEIFKDEVPKNDPKIVKMSKEKAKK